MDEIDKLCVRSFAEGKMRMTRASEISGVSRDKLSYRLSKVNKETGYNPFEFSGLMKLMELVGEE